jgi:hypothetical protein
MVSKYRKPVTHETSRYPPFIVLANHVINQLDHNPDSNICFCRSDPVLIGGLHAERKPDMAGVRYQSLEVSEIVCRQSYERRTKWCLFLVDRAAVVLRVQTHLQTAVRGPGWGCK